MVRWPRWALTSLALVCLCAANASAHPLGNFTVNHLTEVQTAPGSLTGRYTLDIAEIPAFQIMHAVPGAWDGAQLQRWAGEEAPVVAAGLRVTIDGVPQTLTIDDPRAQLRPGAGGLPTLYWTGTFSVPLPAGTTHRVEIADRVYADRRIGWKDVVVAPQTDPTARLTRYPNAAVASPRHNDAVRFTVTPAGAATGVRVTESAVVDTGTNLVRAGLLSDLFARSDRSAWLVALTVLLAFGLGALHGLEPGHGKALLAFTLVGARATVGQAGILAAALTFAHTIAVLLLGLALFFFAGFASERVFAWITLLSGIAVAVVGARALNNAIAHAAPSHDHSHDLGIAPENRRPLNLWSAIVAAMSGGIAPCPAAIVVLLTALRLHRVGEGLLLIVIFSLGLAAVLSALGIAVVKGAVWIGKQKRFDRLARYAPLVTATVIAVVGASMVGQGFVQQGIAASPLVVACLTLGAVAGYAFVPRHQHGEAQAA